MISADGHQPLTTHLFVKGDPYLESDVVQAVKDSLIVDFSISQNDTEANQFGLPIPYYKVQEDFILATTN